MLQAIRLTCTVKYFVSYDKLKMFFRLVYQPTEGSVHSFYELQLIF